MITGRDVIFISSIEWDFLWQIHQEFALQFARAGNRVLYIENTGIRMPRLNDSGRVARRIWRWTKSLFSQGVREVAPGIFVTSPLVMPPFGTNLSRSINRRLAIPALRRVSNKLGFRDPLLWTYLPTDTAVDLIRSLATPGSVVIYYCGADFSLLAIDQKQCRQTEDNLLRVTDVVLTTCSQLADRCKVINDNVHIIPPLVNLDTFSSPITKSEQIENVSCEDENPRRRDAAFLSDLPRPIIGYVGGLHRLIDYELLTALLLKRPEWSWVFVGAITSDVGKLSTISNGHFLGQRPHSELAACIAQFDVCLVPYINDPLTATVVPMKIGEYLAMGKPIVSTALPTVSEFNYRHHVLITAPNESDSFLQAIEDSLSLPNDEQTITRRREVAAIGDGNVLIERISALIEIKINEKVPSTSLIESSI
jgi:glycosyltransferase involved in cell wall biosynthesis